MIAVIDYGVGNLFSVEKAFAQFTDDVKVTSDKAEIKSAEKLLLPGVFLSVVRLFAFDPAGHGTLVP